METENLDKILKKSFSELTAGERAEIQELCATEEEFLHLKQVFASVEDFAKSAQAQNEPAPAVKHRLDDMFYETYQKKGVLWYNALWAVLYPVDKRWYQAPLVRFAAVCVLMISILPIWNSLQLSKENKLMARQETTNTPAAGEKKQKDAVATDEEAIHIESAANVQDNTLMADQAPHADMEKSEALGNNITTLSNPASMKSIRTDDYFIHAEAEQSVSAKYMDMSAEPVISTNAVKDVGYAVSNVNKNLAMLDLLTPTF